MINKYNVIAHAACNSGVVPSFNLPELPVNVQELALEALEEEIMPAINVDRSLDMNITSGVFDVVGEELIFWRFDKSIIKETNVVWGRNRTFEGQVTNLTIQQWIIEENLPSTVATRYKCWYINNEYILMAYVYGTQLNIVSIIPNVFPYLMARVDAVVQESSRIPFAYLYREEFDNIDYRHDPYIYTCEYGADYFKLLFKPGYAGQVRVTYPVPIYISGDEIVAPPKFKKYLIDVLAEHLSVIYGMSTVELMQRAAEHSYNFLVKQMPKPIRPVNYRFKIRDVMKNGQARYWRFDGFL
jgi:hypothetical protein